VAVTIVLYLVATDDRLVAIVTAANFTPDFLFPQMTAGGAIEREWRPVFLDYLYVAFTNASAFSPTDAMPISVRMKTLMLIESIASFLTVGLVAARAVTEHVTPRSSLTAGDRLRPSETPYVTEPEQQR
jgi:hypothetical protein